MSLKFQDPMALAGLAVMSGKPVGEALLEATRVVQQGQYQQQQVDLQRQQQAIRKLQEDRLQKQLLSQEEFKGRFFDSLSAPQAPGGVASPVSNTTNLPMLGLMGEMAGVPGASEYAAALQSRQNREEDVQNQIAREERAAGRKKSEHLEAIQVPGLKVKEGARPSIDDAKKIKEAIEIEKEIQANITELDVLLEKYGTEDFTAFGTAAQDMEGIKETIVTQYNRIAELGALSGDDKKILDGIIPDPNAFFTKGSSVRKQFKRFSKRLKGMIDRKLSTRGYEKTTGKQGKKGAISWEEYFK